MRKEALTFPAWPHGIARWAPVVSGRDADHAGDMKVREGNARVQRPGLIPSLDGIRAISVLIVVLGHSGLERVVPSGLGVTIFFFLSGYLITTLMLTEHERTGGINISNFYIRRVFRLMPCLILSLAIAYGLTFAGLLYGRITGAGLTSQLFYFANYYGLFFDPGNTIPDGTGILWSLAVEEHFYIVFPILMTVMLGNALQPRTIVAVLAGVCVLVLVWRIHLVQGPDFVSERTYYASDTRIDSIIYGCILAIGMYREQGPLRSRKLTVVQWAIMVVAVGTLLLTLVYRDPRFRETFRYSIQGLALMPLFYFAIRFSENRIIRTLTLPWVVTIGTYSYAIYLIHYVVIRFFFKNVPSVAANVFILFPTALLISLVYAMFVDRCIDPYFKELRRKYRPEVADRAAPSLRV